MAKGKEQTMIHNAPHRNIKIEERQTSQWPKEKNRQRFTMLHTETLKSENDRHHNGQRKRTDKDSQYSTHKT
jgi:hypothetical protein